MNQSKTEAGAYAETLAEEARALLAATSEVADEKAAQARQRLSAALERGKEIYADVEEKAIAGARAGDRFVRANPYAAIGIAVGVGLLIGYLLDHRKGD